MACIGDVFMLKKQQKEIYIKIRTTKQTKSRTKTMKGIEWKDPRKELPNMEKRGCDLLIDVDGFYFIARYYCKHEGADGYFEVEDFLTKETYDMKNNFSQEVEVKNIDEKLQNKNIKLFHWAYINKPEVKEND